MFDAILFQVPAATTIDNERLAIALGFTTLIFSLSAFLSCRVCLSWLSLLGVKNPTQKKGYSSFYKYHIYYWWAFGVSLVAHIMVATLHTGLPLAGDPDSGIHWAILGLGLFSGITAFSVFFSCRVFPRLVSLLSPDKPFNLSFYKTYYKVHGYFWLVLALMVAAHFTVSYNHTGLWPSG